MCTPKSSTVATDKPTPNTHLLHVLVTVDVLPLIGVLQLVCLDVLPKGVDDDRPRLGVDPQHSGQSGVQLELHGLQHSKG